MLRGVKNTLGHPACGAPRVRVARLLRVAGELLHSTSGDLISSYFVRGCYLLSSYFVATLSPLLLLCGEYLITQPLTRPSVQPRTK